MVQWYAMTDAQMTLTILCHNVSFLKSHIGQRNKIRAPIGWFLNKVLPIDGELGKLPQEMAWFSS